MHKSVVEVVRNPLGWWDIRDHDGRVAARYVSEYQAWEAGRTLAERCGADLIVHQVDGPANYEAYDSATRRLRPIAERAAGNRPGAGANGGRPLILLVEDAVDARELYAEYLNYAGFAVVTAFNGHEAVKLARLLRPDLILMDVRLPGMDGLEATADLKQDPTLTHIPIVAITADMSDETCARARQAGCSAFITKPALPQDVAASIARMLNAETAQMPGIAERI